MPIVLQREAGLSAGQGGQVLALTQHPLHRLHDPVFHRVPLEEGTSNDYERGDLAVHLGDVCRHEVQIPNQCVRQRHEELQSCVKAVLQRRAHNRPFRTSALQFNPLHSLRRRTDATQAADSRFCLSNDARAVDFPRAQLDRGVDSAADERKFIFHFDQGSRHLVHHWPPHKLLMVLSPNDYPAEQRKDLAEPAAAGR